MLQYDPPKAYYGRGLEKIGLDSRAETSFISHAHLDHFVSKTSNVLASHATLDLFSARGKKVPIQASETHENGCKVRLHEAGHVLGSRMLHAEGDSSFLYTSDFLAEDSLTQKAAKPIEAETVLMECTYGSPQYKFPSRWTVYGQICSWARNQVDTCTNAVIGAYSVGKAQEVVKALNQSGITPLVSGDIAAVNEVYGKHGVGLEYVNVESGEGMEMLKKPFVAVLPMHKVNGKLRENLTHAYGRRTRVAIATGWAKWLGNGADHAFCLSDHNDFEGLVKFAEACSPKKVYCCHGPAEEFASELRKRGIDAQPLETLGEKQKTLEAFSKA